MGSENDKVVFRVDDGKWTPMNYVVEWDPSYLALLHQWDFTEEVIPCRRPADPRNSLHLWKASLPANLPVGNHVLEVKATDMFGKSFVAKSNYKIGQSKGDE